MRCSHLYPGSAGQGSEQVPPSHSQGFGLSIAIRRMGVEGGTLSPTFQGYHQLWLGLLKRRKKKKKESGSKEIEEQTSLGFQLLRSSNKMLKSACTWHCPVSSPARAAAQVSKRKWLVRHRPAPARPAASCPVGSLQVHRTHCQAAAPLLPALLAQHLLPGAFTRGAGTELAAAL